MMKRYVIGDIHGNYKGLKECLEGVSFDIENDLLICLGDICDGWSQTKECMDLLMTLKKMILIKGNHDVMMLDYYQGKLGRTAKEMWLNQGGFSTLESLGKTLDEKYSTFLSSGKLYHILDNYYFAHASIPLLIPFNKTSDDYFYWDRTMINTQYHYPKQLSSFDKIFIGHTPTFRFDKLQITPLKLGNVYMMDTGAAFTGSICIMDIDTENYFLSEPSMFSYPTEKGRN